MFCYQQAAGEANDAHTSVTKGTLHLFRYMYILAAVAELGPTPCLVRLDHLSVSRLQLLNSHVACYTCTGNIGFCQSTASACLNTDSPGPRAKPTPALCLQKGPSQCILHADIERSVAWGATRGTNRLLCGQAIASCMVRLISMWYNNDKQACCCLTLSLVIRPALDFGLLQSTA